MRTDKKPPKKIDKKTPSRMQKRGVVGYSKKSALLEEAITHMNAGKYGRSSAALKELLSLDPHNTEARRLFATLHLRLGSLATARQAFESLANEAIERQDFWLAESLLREYLVAGPRCVPFLELLGHVYEEKGDAVAAVTELGKAIDVLIEDPDSENPKKPSELYAKIRELAPASSVACQFASLFDIQTGELLLPRPLAPSAIPSLDATPQSPDGILLTTGGDEPSDVMPWEQFDGTLPNHEIPPSISSKPVRELLDVQDVLPDVIDPAPVSFVPQVPEVLPSESTESIQKADRLEQDGLPSILDESLILSSEDRNGEMWDSIIEPSLLVEERLPPSSSGERTAEVEGGITSPSGSLGLSSPMPWEQIENSTIRIEETAPSTVPIAQSNGPSLLGGESLLAPPPPTHPECVSDQLPSPDPAQEFTKPRESIFAEEPLTSPAELREPEVPPQSVKDSSSTVPFSWNAVFDDALKLAAETLSSNSPAALSKPGAKELASAQAESVSELELSTPSTSPAMEPPVAFNDPEPLRLIHPSIAGEASGSISEIHATKEPDLPWSTPVSHSEEPPHPEESETISSDAPSFFKVELPVPSQSECLEPARESEPVSFPPLLQLQPVTPESSVPDSPLSAVIPESLPMPEPVSEEYHEIPITLFQPAEGPPFSIAPSDAPTVPPASMETPAHWSTGEVEVQSHRPSEKKRQWDKDKGKGESPVVTPSPLPLVEESSEVVADLSRSGGWESALPETVAPVVEAIAPLLENVVPQDDTRPEWVRASESITFVNPPPPSSSTWQDTVIEFTHTEPEPVPLVAASTADVLLDSTGEKSHLRTQDRVASPRPRPRLAARVSRVRIGISSFIGSCFSTTRSMVLLCAVVALSCVVLGAVGIGVIGLAWMVMEAPPSPVYHNLTASPPRTFPDSKKNGYHILLGFGASAEQDPLQAGYERKAEENDLQAARACMLGDEGKGMTTSGASANVVRGWFTSADPAAAMKPQAAAVRSWVTQESVALRRYQQWLSMPFEDVGYGQILSPNCAHVLFAHRLYLADGFAQDFGAGLERLETDMGSWRVALGQSKTLMIKMMAVAAVEDDVALASGLLIRQDLDGETVARLGKIVRPLDQVELSLRWPMQSHLVWATKSVTTSLKDDKTNERPLHVSLVAAMPLPVQRRSNAYADYYEAASKAMAEGRYTNMPKLSSFIQTPADSTLDYLANPIEHIIGIEPLPSWDHYVGRIVETDARLRLAGLQAWVRRGPQEGNLLMRLAKAGQAHYDPFTGLPMLVDQQKGVMYSVGRDGKDQEGDPLHDVVATIPKSQSVVIENSRSVPPSRSK